MKASILVKRQSVTKTVEGFRFQGGVGKLVIDIGYDDDCGNGHNSFYMSSTMYRDDINQQGCNKEDIANYGGEYADLLKWNSMTSEGPLYYIDNTHSHATNKDGNGLLKGEYSAYTLSVVSSEVREGDELVIYKSGQIYTNRQNNPNLAKSNNEEQELLALFTDKLKVKYDIIKINSPHSLSEGSEPDLAAARLSAIWPDATLEQLLDKSQLKARLPSLIEEFRKVIVSLGMVY